MPDITVQVLVFGMSVSNVDLRGVDSECCSGVTRVVTQDVATICNEFIN